jgi:hypothetical protein
VAEKKRAAAGRASILAKLDAAIGQIDERHGAIATRWSKLGKTPAEPSTDHLLRADIRLAAVLAAAGPSPDLPALATRAFEIGDRLLVRAILTLGMVASGDTIALRQLARACSGRASAVSREALLGDPEGAQLAAEAHALSTLRRQLAGLRQDAKGNMRDEPEILRQRAAKLFGQLASK